MTMGDDAEGNEGEGEGEAAAAEGSGEPSDAGFPVRTAITISKGDDSGALTIDAVAQDGMFMIDSVAFYPDAKVGLDMTADGDWQRRALYMGPEFDALDESLQEEFEAFLEERGINSNLALIVPGKWLASHPR
jgi:complement component 1 Q subcomponent-binding protein